MLRRFAALKTDELCENSLLPFSNKLNSQNKKKKHRNIVTVTKRFALQELMNYVSILRINVICSAVIHSKCNFIYSASSECGILTSQGNTR